MRSSLLAVVCLASSLSYALICNLIPQLINLILNQQLTGTATRIK
jgi:hypothetical protein